MALSAVDTLVTQYMSLQRRPLTDMTAKKSNLSSSLDKYSKLKTNISDLLSAAKELADTSTSSVYNSRTTSTSDDTKITASAGTGAATGTFQVRVKQLASGASLQSLSGIITKSGTQSGSKVAAGSGSVDVTKTFASAGFAGTIDTSSTVTISDGTNSWTSNTLGSYASVQAFMDAVNDSVGVGSFANANMYYDKTADKFVVESKNASGTNLVLTQSSTTGFLAQANIKDQVTGLVIADTASHTYSTATPGGIQTGALLYKANFNTSTPGAWMASTDTGSFKINGVSIAWDADTDTLDGVISRINSSTANVNAYYDTSLNKLVFKSKGAGSSDTISWSDTTGTFLGSTMKMTGATVSAGTDAKLTVNSTAAGDEITKSSNTFTLNGTTYTLKNTNVTAYTDSTYTAITVKHDTGSVQTKISGFLDKFNSVTDYIKSNSGNKGIFSGNTTFINLKDQLFKKLSEQVTGLTTGNPDYLSKIGITVSSGLKASISDSTKFTKALTDNPSGVEALFDSTNGIAAKIKSLISPFVESTSTTRGSIIDETKNVISRQMNGVDTMVGRMESRLKIIERQYRQRLTQMQDLLNSAALQGQQIQKYLSATGG